MNNISLKVANEIEPDSMPDIDIDAHYNQVLTFKGIKLFFIENISDYELILLFKVLNIK